MTRVWFPSVTVTPVLDPTQPHSQYILGPRSSGINLPTEEADHTLRSSPFAEGDDL